MAASVRRNSGNLEETRSIEPTDRLRGVGRTLSLRDFVLERQPTSQLDDALGALRRGDLAVVARRDLRCGVGETHHVEGVGGFGSELERDSMLEGNGAEDS